MKLQSESNKATWRESMAINNAVAERVGEVDHQDQPDANAVNEMGLTPTEQAEFDQMRTGAPAPADDSVTDDGDDGDTEGAEGEQEAARGEGEPEPAAAGDKEKAPVTTPEAQRTPKTVNYTKYQRELKKANDALAAERTEKQKLKDDGIRLAERVRMIDEALRSQPQAPAPDPTAEEIEAAKNPFEEQDIDPQEDFAAAVAQVNRRARFQYESQQNLQENFQATAADRDMKDTFERDFRMYAQTDPHVVPAYQFLKDSRLTEISITKFDKDPRDPEEIQTLVNIFNNEEKWVVGEAIKNRRSPAQAIMKAALARGYVRPQAAPPAAPAPPAPKARAPAPVVPAAPAAPAGPTAAEQLEIG